MIILMRITLIIVIGVWMTLVGCTPVDGSDPYALWETFENDEYHFHYLSPPWKQVGTFNASLQVLAVDPNGEPLSEAELPGDGLDGHFNLIVRQGVPHDDAQGAAQEDLNRWKAQGATVEPLEPFRNAAGDQGVQALAHTHDRWITSVYHDLTNGGTVFMTVIGKIRVDTADITLMMKSLEPRPPDGD
ncbi:MAG: hypothetical protein GY847_15515 [Proteobacteria bacterium]|nr:hypothetical protein [Pseudomonadota bacterium]